MTINIIAAMTKERVIGIDNKLPWYIPADLINFKRLTSEKTVVMGRNTYDSLPAKFRPLPNRRNIVISRSMPEQEGIDVCRNIDEAIEKAQSYQTDIFIIGGAAIYEQTLPLADRMYLTFIKQKYEGDTFFPKFNEEKWHKQPAPDELKKDSRFELFVYTRK